MPRNVIILANNRFQQNTTGGTSKENVKIFIHYAAGGFDGPIDLFGEVAVGGQMEVTLSIRDTGIDSAEILWDENIDGTRIYRSSVIPSPRDNRWPGILILWRSHNVHNVVYESADSSVYYTLEGADKS